MIDQASIENLKSRLDVVDVVGSYIELKKSGANFKGLCPFHGENTPSFVVSPAKQIYHCFGCGAGGDAIKFVMEYEKLNYPEAIEKLASQYNIQLRYTENEKRESKDKKILESLNLYFRKNLDHYPPAKNYLLERGIFESSIEKFEIGYAPESYKTLDFLRKEKVAYSDAKNFGIVAVGENGKPYARFSQRITFPIFTPGGRIVGFGGRTITGHPAKYINSPQSAIFDKSRLLYGYHKAKTTIFQKGEVIVTEGYLDVIMLHQAGFTNAVATLGTALTDSHIPILRKGDPKVILAYDGDKAGVQAAYKAASLLSSKGVHGGVVLFREGMDPADMVKNNQTQMLQQLFRNPKPLIEFSLEHIVFAHNLRDPLQKEAALKEAKSYLQRLSPLLQQEYAGYLAALLNIDPRLVKVGSREMASPQPLQKRVREDIAELSMIKTMLEKRDLIDMVLDTVGEELFVTHRDLLSLLLQESYEEPALTALQIRDDIKILTEEELKEQLRKLLIRHYREALSRVKRSESEQKYFRIRKIQEYLRTLKQGKLVIYESF
ncbi:MAG: DNA primase [Campylobacteraceae bacterium 4484_4]|nr:MAG: DNA primase [Campylobacteraceae bacterium 4484_4]